jgi:MoxR-like ATPase
MPAEATSFVGRRRELAEARKKLADARLVSLTGPGGVGKTRLATRIATDLGRGFPGGRSARQRGDPGGARGPRDRDQQGAAFAGS